MKLLIVDDEIRILEGIKKGVAWDQLPFSDVLYAQSVEEAQEKLGAEKIDLVLTDIEMDRMSGLDLVNWINEKLPETECLILSCHEEFDFARRAVALHCLEYILKPVPYEQLTEILAGAAEKVRRDHSSAMLETYGKIYMKQLSEEKTEEAKADAPEDDLVVLTRYIREHIGEDISVEFLAKLVHLSPRQLNRNCQKELGMPLSDYITKQRMMLAADLLKEKKLSVTMVADRVGYGNYSYFTKQFRKAYGVSPREFQNG